MGDVANTMLEPLCLKSEGDKRPFIICPLTYDSEGVLLIPAHALA